MMAKSKPYLQSMPYDHIKTTMGQLTEANPTVNAMTSH